MPAVRLALVANTKSGASDRAQKVAEALRAEGAEVELLDFAAVCDDPASVAAGWAPPANPAAGDPPDGSPPGNPAAGDPPDGSPPGNPAAGDPADGSPSGDPAGRAKPHRIVAAGGDGSLGPAGLLALRADLPLAVVPIGTANSFARWMRIPLKLEDAAQLAADPDARTTAAEVADADGRPFVNVAATGLSVLAAHRARPLKKRLGPLAYAVGAARAATRGQPLHTTVVADGRTAWEGDAWQVLVAATGAFGGDSATGGVDTDDGELDVAIVPAGPRYKLLRRAYAMRRGKLVHEEEVHHERGADVTLTVDGDPEFNVDGEVLDLDEARFRVLGRIPVVVR